MNIQSNHFNPKRKKSPVPPTLLPPTLQEALTFAGMLWFSSRLLIWAAMLISVSLNQDAQPGAIDLGNLDFRDLLAQWDGRHYEKIATRGYEFRDDGKGHRVAFFPLLPLLMHSLMPLGLSAAMAGALVNNLAFLGALVVLYLWMRQRQGKSIARWSTAVLAWCPFSLFGSVVYTEGLFLLFSTAALRAFDQKQYRWAMVWGSLTTACRLPGIALVPTFLIVAWQERRGTIAGITAGLTSLGLLSYMGFCGWRFQQPIAFLIAQRHWNGPQAFHGSVWIDFFERLFFGAVNEDQGKLVDWGYPLALVLIGAIAIGLYRQRDQLGSTLVGYGFCGLVFLSWVVAGMELVTAAMVFGGLGLLWQLRQVLPRLVWVYGLCSWVFILGNGRTISSDRYAYGCVSLAIALGWLLSRSPRWNYATLLFFAMLLVSYSVRFAQGLWAG